MRSMGTAELAHRIAGMIEQDEIEADKDGDPYRMEPLTVCVEVTEDNDAMAAIDLTLASGEAYRIFVEPVDD